MIWSFTVLPSGSEMKSRAVTLSPVEGATSSSSQRSMNERKASRTASASGVFASASNSSREVTSDMGSDGTNSKKRRRRGSRRVSAAMSRVMATLDHMGTHGS